MLFTILREIVILSTKDRPNGRTAGIATAVIFVLVLLFFGVISAINLTHRCWKSEEYGWVKIALVIVEICAAVFYFYGENVGFIYTQYGEALGCDEECMEDNRLLEILAIGIALLFYQILPSCVRKIGDYKNLREQNYGWYSAADMLAVILKTDALFTVVVSAATQTTDFCSSRTDVQTSVAFFAISILVGVLAMTVFCIITTLQFKQNPNSKDWHWIVPFTYLILVVCFPLFVLSDNPQPLDCAWGCDSFIRNVTLNNERNCNIASNAAMRLGFSVVAFLSIVSVLLLLYGCRHNTAFKTVAKSDDDKSVTKESEL